MISVNERVFSVIFKAITEVNQQLLPEQRIDPSPETVLIGEQAQLDSMGLVSLLVFIKGEIVNEFGIDFTFIDENSVLDENIFKNVSSLASYLSDIVNQTINR